MQKKSSLFHSLLVTMILLMAWINCLPVLANTTNDANGNMIFNTADPNPYPNYINLNTSGADKNIIYQTGAGHYTTAANTTWYIYGGGTTTINLEENAYIDNQYIYSANGTISASSTNLIINNAGTISCHAAGATYGTITVYAANLDINNQATGVISGYNNGGYAVHNFSNLTNYGTINGSLTGNDSDNTATFYPGSTINGIIDFQAGTDLLILADTPTSANGTFENYIGNLEELRKTGTNTWTFNAQSPATVIYTQQSNILEGTFENNADVRGSVNVANGATIKGSGRFYKYYNDDTMTIQAGGIVAPGNSVGTLSATMDVTFDPNAVLQIEVDGSGCDLFDVTGSVTLDNPTLRIIPLVTDVTSSEVIFLRSDTALTGEFATINVDVVDTATIDFLIRYYERTATLQANVSQFEEKALWPNQKKLGHELDNLPTNMSDLGTAMRGIVGEDNLRNEMDRLRPNGAPIRTVFSNAQGFSQDSLQLARSAQQGNTRFAAAPGQSMLKQLNDDPYSLAQDSEQATEQANISDGKLHFFASPFGQFGDIDSSDARTGYSYDAYGAIIGVDYNCIPNMSLGLSLGYINTDIGLDNSAGDSNVDTLRFGPYLTYTNGNWNVDASITGGFHWVDGRRNTIMGTAESDYNSYDFTIYGAASYDMQLDKVTLSPTFSLTYVHQMTDDYAESGAGTANLTVEDMQTDSLQSLLGVHASMPVMLGNLALTPEAWIGWKYEWLDRDVDINSAFSANVTSPFTTTSEGTSRSQFVAGAAVFSQINETTSLKLNYELNTASDVTIHSVWAMIELNF